MTPSELETAARHRYNAINDPHFSSAMILDIIYQASMQIAVDTLAIEQTYSTVSVAGTREYAYPANAFAIRRVEYAGKKLRFTTLESDPKTSTTQVSGTPAEYALWNGEMILFPTPAIDNEVIKVFTYNRPSAVTAISVLEIPSEYHLDMIDLILSVMYAKDQNNTMATYHRNLWERSLNRIKMHNRKKKSGDEFHIVRDQDFIDYGVTL